MKKLLDSGSAEADSIWQLTKPSGYIPRGCTSLPFFYFLTLIRAVLLYHLTRVWNTWLELAFLQLVSRVRSATVKICRICAKAKSFTLAKDVSTCLVMCSREYWNNIGESSKNKPAEPESYWKHWQKSILSQWVTEHLWSLEYAERQRLFCSRNCLDNAVNVYVYKYLYMYAYRFFYYYFFSLKEMSPLNTFLGSLKGQL